MGLFNKKSKKEEEEKPEKATEVMPEEKQAEPGDVKVVLPKGKSASSYSVISNPYVTEKSSMLAQFNQYVFKVSKNSNKKGIKDSVEKLYNVKVEDVRVVNLPSKTRRIGRTLGVKAGYKKAIVSLREGDKIEVV
ncbi:MAG: 50S ribosomal protein L23 [bacterium]|nr:50S ribosomal protein L23 [bacterium]